MGPSTNEVKFSLTRRDCQVSFKGLITKRDLVYRQYCLPPAPKDIKKMIISYFTGATRFPYYIALIYICSKITSTSTKSSGVAKFTVSGRKKCTNVKVDGTSFPDAGSLVTIRACHARDLSSRFKIQKKQNRYGGTKIITY